jgi:hypothetical protein
VTVASIEAASAPPAASGAPGPPSVCEAETSGELVAFCDIPVSQEAIKTSATSVPPVRMTES